jgi:hypothetical protein
MRISPRVAMCAVVATRIVATIPLVVATSGGGHVLLAAKLLPERRARQPGAQRSLSVILAQRQRAEDLCRRPLTRPMTISGPELPRSCQCPCLLIAPMTP